MTQRRIWYFCEQVFKPRGWSATNELVCYRMPENDPRASTWNKKNMFFTELPATDPVSEKAWLASKYRYLRFGKLIIKDAPKEGEELK